jgi:DNA-binding response OmpR family regulator
MKAKIMVVDDEALVRQSLEDILRLEGYDTKSVPTGDVALDMLQDETFDLILLDLRMPGIDGIEVLEGVTKVSPDTKVILLTGHGSLESAIKALRQGAHDYLLKPVSSHELLSSVEGALKLRTEQQQKRLLLDQLESSIQRLKDVEGIEALSTFDQQVIELESGVKVDLPRREIWRGNQRVSLTPTEGKLMKVLLENRGRVLTHRELVLLVQGYETTDWEAPEVLRPLISRLRRKLSAFPGGEKWIANVRGTGYVFDDKKGSKSERENTAE